MATGVLAHITSQAASSRMLAALTVMYWAKESAAGQLFRHADISKALVEALKRPKADRGAEGRLQRYPELTALYSQAHNATVRLLKLVCSLAPMVSGVQFLMAALHCAALSSWGSVCSGKGSGCSLAGLVFCQQCWLARVVLCQQCLEAAVLHLEVPAAW